MGIKAKTALYARVSTDVQAEKGFSIEAQLDKLRAYCALNDIPDYEEYIDAGYSASSLDRPEIKRLIQDIQLGLVDTVVVYKLDRLSRKTKDTLYIVEDIFNKHGVKFVSLSESLDTSSSSGKFFLSILSSVAQLERENIRERGMLGMKKKAELGIKSRTPKILIGYDFDEKNKKYIINEYEALQIRLIFERYAAGEGVSTIFRFLEENYTTKYGKWKTVKSVQHILDNKTYLGNNFKYQNTFIEGNNIPQIIDEELFSAVQKIRDYGKAHYHRHTSAYMLTGLMFCDVCGARLRGYVNNRGNTYYICYSRDSSRPHMKKADKCTLPYFRRDDLDNAIAHSLKTVAKSKSFFEKQRKKKTDHTSEIATLEREIKKLNEKSSRIVDLLIESGIDKETFTARLIDVNNQKTALEEQLKLLKNVNQAQISVNYEETKELINAFSSADLPQKRKILAQLIEKIVLHEDKSFDIEWLF